MPKYFFASYAQMDRDRDQYLERFVTRVRDELKSLRAQPDPNRVAFFDRDIKAGERWSDMVIDAVNEADVLVCLMSPSYFTRPWCGRELSVFLDRCSRLEAGAQAAGFIFPIWWKYPTAPRPLPRPLAEFNYRDPDFPPDYESEGGHGLADGGRWGQFRRLATLLARRISETLDRPHRLPPGAPVADILKIANAFDEQQPYDVQLVALTAGGGAWTPTPRSPSVDAAAEATAERLQVFIRPVQTGPGVEQRLEEGRDQEQLLLVVANASTPADALAQAIDGLKLPDLALLLVETQPGTADGWLAALPGGAFAEARARGMVRISRAEQMGDEMERLVDEARRRMMARAPAARVEDPALDRDAAGQGIATGVQPTLAGPGAGGRP
jgi:hypothetical protein